MSDKDKSDSQVVQNFSQKVKQLSHEEIVLAIKRNHQHTQRLVNKKYGSNPEPLYIDRG